MQLIFNSETIITLTPIADPDFKQPLSTIWLYYLLFYVSVPYLSISLYNFLFQPWKLDLNFLSSYPTGHTVLSVIDLFSFCCDIPLAHYSLMKMHDLRLHVSLVIKIQVHDHRPPISAYTPCPVLPLTPTASFLPFNKTIILSICTLLEQLVDNSLLLSLTETFLKISIHIPSSLSI